MKKKKLSDKEYEMSKVDKALDKKFAKKGIKEGSKEDMRADKLAKAKMELAKKMKGKKK